MAFFLVALDARSGRVVDIVGSNVGANGHPLALGRRCAARRSGERLHGAGPAKRRSRVRGTRVFSPG